MPVTNPLNRVLEHVKRIGRITNRDCRQLLDTSYDQSVFLLGRMCSVGVLRRKGASSGTHYVLSEATVPAAALQKLDAELKKRLV
jgi:hypothetical protein